MSENLKELVSLFKQDEKIQEIIQSNNWEGQRLSMIKNILETFAYNAEIKTLVFEYRNAGIKPNDVLDTSVNFYPNINKDLKLCLFLNEHISNKFSNTKLQILPKIKKEQIIQSKYLRFSYMLEDNIPNKKFYEEVFSLTENTYPLFQYFILDRKVNNKIIPSTTKKKI